MCTLFKQRLTARKPFLVVLAVLLFVAISANAQVDSVYIKDYKNQLTARIYSLNEAVNLEINPLAGGPNLSYRPNTQQHLGIAAFYKWFGLGLAVKSPFASANNDRYGESQSIDLRINAYGSWINAELAYANYQGFYLENTAQIITNYQEGEKLYWRPDLDIQSLSGIFYLVANYKKHSFRAAYIQNEYQKKSSGSLLIAPAFQFNRLRANKSLIPDDYIIEYGIFDQDELVRGKLNMAGIFVGYSYSVVILKKFYINIAMLPGAFIQYYNYHTEEKHYRKTNAYFLWTSRFAAGYNGNKWFAGMGGVSGFNDALAPIKTSAYALGLEQFRVWVGTRLKFKE
ncbi:MAG: DUF4421 family protein [Bacteroidetes bacterium]|jgi:hypothetical protein|nr:DUF4421 family protein [Bacteroidota bacterium]